MPRKAKNIYGNVLNHLLTVLSYQMEWLLKAVNIHKTFEDLSQVPASWILLEKYKSWTEKYETLIRILHIIEAHTNAKVLNRIHLENNLR